MPTYTYEGDEGRYYSTLGLEPEPGASHELERNPGDGRWSPPDPEPEPEPAAAAEDATDTPAPAKPRRRPDTTKAGD
jgi:hypothetical protein